MELFKEYITINFILILVAVVMYIYAIQKFHQHPRISTYSILIVSFALTLSVVEFLQDYFKIQGILSGTYVCAISGYTLRPICVYLFILMTYRGRKNRVFWLSIIPLALNFFVYLLGVFPATSHLVQHFEGGGSVPVRYIAGDSILHYFSHIVSLAYVIWLIYISISVLKFKHISHGLTILMLAFFVIISVVLESFFNKDGTLNLLNPTIAVSCMVYYLYLHIEQTQVDMLTGLFNRETYYHDLPRMEKSLTGIVQFDMNGLKFINDHYGHLEGDKAIHEIAFEISACCSKRMYAYRLGGDEFLVLVNDTKEEDVLKYIELVKRKISEMNYSCSIGYAYRSDKNISLETLFKESEKRMYEDKAEFYKDGKHERRKI